MSSAPMSAAAVAPVKPRVVDEKTPLVAPAGEAVEPRRARPVVEVFFALSMLFFFGMLVVRHLVFPAYDQEFKLALFAVHLLNTVLAHFVLLKNCASRTELALYLLAVDGVSAPVLFWTARGLGSVVGL